MCVKDWEKGGVMKLNRSQHWGGEAFKHLRRIHCVVKTGDGEMCQIWCEYVVHDDVRILYE